MPVSDWPRVRSYKSLFYLYSELSSGGICEEHVQWNNHLIIMWVCDSCILIAPDSRLIAFIYSDLWWEGTTRGPWTESGVGSQENSMCRRVHSTWKRPGTVSSPIDFASVVESWSSTHLWQFLYSSLQNITNSYFESPGRSVMELGYTKVTFRRSTHPQIVQCMPGKPIYLTVSILDPTELQLLTIWVIQVSSRL